jgi:hypothetical protein
MFNVLRAGLSESLAHEPAVRLAPSGFWCAAPPSAWNFARPCSGAHRVAWTQQHAQRFACRFGRIPCARTGNAIANGSPWLCGTQCPRSSCWLDPGRTIGQTPAKPGSSRQSSPRCQNPTTRSLAFCGWMFLVREHPSAEFVPQECATFGGNLF